MKVTNLTETSIHNAGSICDKSTFLLELIEGRLYLIQLSNNCSYSNFYDLHPSYQMGFVYSIAVLTMGRVQDLSDTAAALLFYVVDLL